MRLHTPQRNLDVGTQRAEIARGRGVCAESSVWENSPGGLPGYVCIRSRSPSQTQTVRTFPIPISASSAEPSPNLPSRPLPCLALSP